MFFKLQDDLQELKPTDLAVVPRILNRLFNQVMNQVNTSTLKSALMKKAIEAKYNDMKR